MVWPCKQKTSEKTFKQALLAKAKGKKTVGRPRPTVDESILHWRFWVELLGTSPKQNDGGDGRPLPPQPSQESGQWREKDFSLKFSMVLFAFLLFVLLKLHLYKFFISSTSFFTSSIIFITNKLLEFQLRGGKNCAFDSIAIRSRNSSWQPTARIYRSSNGI